MIIAHEFLWTCPKIRENSTVLSTFSVQGGKHLSKKSDKIGTKVRLSEKICYKHLGLNPNQATIFDTVLLFPGVL